VIVEKSPSDRKTIQDTLSEHYVFSDLSAKTISDVVDGVRLCAPGCLFALLAPVSLACAYRARGCVARQEPRLV
jgi:hypothetical protein